MKILIEVICDVIEGYTNTIASFNRHVQVMSFADAEKWRFNPFDLTKVWPHSEYPLR